MDKLLLIDDDKEVLEINKKYFIQLGYDVRIAESTSDALKVLKGFMPDCVLLDVMMPGESGFEAFESIKRHSNDAPVIFLTGRISEDDKVTGLMLGADDYIEKPYSLKELQARVLVQLRKKKNQTSMAANASILNIPPLKLNIVSHQAFYGDTEIPLANREYELLYLLAQTPNKIVPFEKIGERFFGVYSDADRRTVMVTASRLRKKIEDYTGLDNIIETAYSKGYILRITDNAK